jgi:MFS family permease
MALLVFAVILSGVATKKSGRYWPSLLVGPVFAAVGSGLMYTINEATPLAHVYGFQIITGFGVGLFFQNTSMALQAEFKDHPRLIGQGTGLGMFTQFLGGTIGLSIAEAAFSSQLGKNLLKYAPDVDKDLIIESPVNIYTQVPAGEVAAVVRAYCKSLDIVVSF